MVENIDIGGPSMVRGAAKNFKDTVVIVDKADYGPVVDSLINERDLPLEKRRQLAAKAFSYTSFYDSLIGNYLNMEEPNPNYKNMAGRKSMDLRYGENPHQKASLYISNKKSPLHKMTQLQGKELSFNNILDLSMVYEVINQYHHRQIGCYLLAISFNGLQIALVIPDAKNNLTLIQEAAGNIHHRLNNTTRITAQVKYDACGTLVD